MKVSLPLFRIAIVASAALWFLAGCGHSPESGDWYEKIDSHERIQITGVGTGSELKSALDEYDKRFTPSMATIKVFYAEGDSDTDCFDYTTMRTFNSRYLIEHHIYPVDRLKEEFRWIENPTGATP